MNKRPITCATIGLALCGLAAAANADIIMGQPVTSPSGLSTASIEFRGSSAGYTGELYFLGWGTEGSVLHEAPDSKHSRLGQFLFNNHHSAEGSQITLDGVFESGSVLHFAYEITNPRSRHDLFRTDEEDDRFNFAYDPGHGALAVEDLRMDSRGYDGDFNDAMFNVSFQSIPAPGSLALLGLGGLAMARRRRR